MNPIDSCRSPPPVGFSMPAEWAPHEGCLVSWPCNARSFSGHLWEAEMAFASVIDAVGRFKPVTVLVDSRTIGAAMSSLGERHRLLQLELDDSWIRDNGPIFLKSQGSEVAMVDFGFNAWGRKSTFQKDAAVPARLSAEFGVRRYEAPMVLEGGSISVDGEGTLLTTEQCLLNPNRNPDLSQEQIEQNLKDYLGVSKILWLERGQEDDITDGHVDGVACFCGPRTVMAARTMDRYDPNHTLLEANRSRLETLTDAKGRALEVIDIVQPSPREYLGQPITPGYINHYIANDGVVAPEFGIPEDNEALETLLSAYPGREIVCVNASAIEVGGGGIHCITQQIPEGGSLR